MSISKGKEHLSQLRLVWKERAVGSTCGANRIPIVIPCHRVVSSSGLGGFGGGLRRKKFLLNLESN